MDISTKYIYHIDDLRRERKIKVIDFCADICTERQYRRYLSGDNLISQKNLSLFISQLNMTDNDFYNSFHTSDTDEYLQVSELFRLLNTNQHTLAEQCFDKINPEQYHSKLVKDFFTFNTIYYKQIKKSISNIQALDKYSLLIDYPNVLSKKSFNFIEILSLNKITSLEATINKFQTAERLYEILKNEKFRYLSSNSRYILPTIYSELARVFGMKNDIPKSLEICDEGIKYSLSTQDMNALPHLYYLKALGLYNMKDRNTFTTYFHKCLMTCLIKNDKKLFTLFKNMSQRDFSFSIQDLDKMITYEKYLT